MYHPLNNHLNCSSLQAKNKLCLASIHRLAQNWQQKAPQAPSGAAHLWQRPGGLCGVSLSATLIHDHLQSGRARGRERWPPDEGKRSGNGTGRTWDGVKSSSRALLAMLDESKGSREHRKRRKRSPRATGLEAERGASVERHHRVGDKCE